MSEPKILLVEDEQIAGMDIREMIKEAGYESVTLKNTAESALDYINSDSVNLVLMDINLPGEKDGIEAAREINQNHGIPLIYLTAFSDEETLRRARSTQPAGFLVKPVTRADVKASIEMALGNSTKPSQE
ncbi:MAG: response regulator [bacterium]